MNPDAQAALARSVRWALRDDAHALGLQPDADGWVLLDGLLTALRRDRPQLTVDELLALVTAPGRPLEQAGDRVRLRRRPRPASLPHEVAAAPPDRLFAGVARRWLHTLLQDGLHSTLDRPLRLFVDPASARAEGRRHGEPVVLAIDAGRLHAERGVFVSPTAEGWTTDHVPADYLSVREDW